MLGKLFNWILGNKQSKQIEDQITDSVTVQNETVAKVKKPRKPRSPNKKKKV